MPASMALTLRANILAQQWATVLGKGVSASDPNIYIPGTEAHQKYQAAIRTAEVVSSQIANQRDLAAVTVSYAAQSICSGNVTHTFDASFVVTAMPLKRSLTYQTPLPSCCCAQARHLCITVQGTLNTLLFLENIPSGFALHLESQN